MSKRRSKPTEPSRSATRRSKASGAAESAAPKSLRAESPNGGTTQGELPALIVGGTILLAAFTWAYWPTLVGLVTAWDREPDYSHGYLVAPLALLFLWIRRDRFPGAAEGLSWTGLVLIAAAFSIRIAGAQVFLDAADGWSILFWVGGVVWLFWGRRVFWWSLPSIAFLWFMVPLPYRVERWLSLPLQRIATKLSCWILQCFGQPALGEGNTINLGPHTLEVEEACSGLRIFVGIVALAFAYIIVVRRSWWERGLLLAAVIPIALLANAIRIVITAFLYQHVSGEAAQRFSHDFAGIVMIPLAAAMFGVFLWYMGKLAPAVEVVDVGSVVRRDRE